MKRSSIEVITSVHSVVEKTNIDTISKCHSPNHLLIQEKLYYLLWQSVASPWNQVITISITNSGDVMY